MCCGDTSEGGLCVVGGTSEGGLCVVGGTSEGGLCRATQEQCQALYYCVASQALYEHPYSTALLTLNPTPFPSSYSTVE